MEYMNGMENQGMAEIAAQAVMTAGRSMQPFPASPTNAPVVQPPVVQEEKSYTLRGLCAKDIYPMSVIIRKVGLKDIAACFDPEEINAIMGSVTSGEGGRIDTDKIAETVGIGVTMKIVDVVLANLSQVEPEVFTFLGSLSGMTADDIGNLPMDVFFGMLVDVFKKKEFSGFMKVVSKLLK